ncbi:MAG: caspase family protein [Bacteroidia bacterium]|nr:caspase family protein [Bacteroidia bacterium]
MRIYITVIALSLITLNASPQTVIKSRSVQGYVSITRDASGTQYMASVIKGRSASGYVNIFTEVAIKPPHLEADNPQFLDADGNNFINANENTRIFFTVRNNGEGPALNLEAKITEQNKVPGLSFQPRNLGTLQPGEVKTVEIPVISNINTSNSTASFLISINETNGFGIDIGTVVIQTKAMLTPMVAVTDIDYGGVSIRKNEKFNVKVLVQNTGQGNAEGVILTLPLIENIMNLSANNSYEIGTLAPGETREVQYTLITNNNYNLSKIILPFVISEKYGKYADNSKNSVTILMDLQLTAAKQVVVQGEQRAVPETRPDAAAASFTSDVDKDIPNLALKNTKRIALIIGNEDYSHAFDPESNVNFAENDASELIFYYAGHGFPDQVSKIPYLIPVDVSASSLTSAVKLADVYTQLSSSVAGRVTVFLDACFSGGGRDMGSGNARSVRMAPSTEESLVSGNMIVFTASTGEQTAQALSKEKHGLFTYYLLKKMKETSGNVTYGDLFTYLIETVPVDALTVNKKEQVPVCISSDLLGEKWKTWKLR